MATIGPKIAVISSEPDAATYGDDMRHLFRMLQAIVQANVKDVALTAPPVAPSNGDTYAVAVGGSGAWAGKDNNISYWTLDDPNVPTGKWDFYAPLNGWFIFNNQDSNFYRFNSGTPAWQIFTAGGGGTSLASFANPTTSFFGRSEIDALANGIDSGDPQIVFDSANNQYVMFYYYLSGLPIQTRHRVATSLEGPWTVDTQVTTLNQYHKFRVLVDVNGVPLQVAGLFYGVGVFYNGLLTDKEIFLFSSPTLQGDTWTAHGKVVAHGASGAKDGFNCDAPNFVLYKNVYYIWYMGAPDISLPDFGFAERTLLATAAVVTGPYVKTGVDILDPNTDNTQWDFGWIGGTQILQNNDGTFFIAYNAGSTRPSGPGLEPATSLFGFATAATPGGVWTKVAGPFAQLTNLPAGSIEQTDIWRPYAFLDPVTNTWYIYYNTSTGVEIITFARQGYLWYQFSPPSGSPYNFQTMTTLVAQIIASYVELRPGRYRITFMVNVAQLDTTNPGLDVTIVFRHNGVATSFLYRIFVGSFNFQNFDTISVAYVNAGIGDNIDFTVQVTNNVPNAASFLRDLRMLVEKVA